LEQKIGTLENILRSSKENKPMSSNLLLSSCLHRKSTDLISLRVQDAEFMNNSQVESILSDLNESEWSETSDLKFKNKLHHSQKAKTGTQRRLSRDMVSFLELKMEEHDKWDIKYLRKLSKSTGLKVSQLYKWNWDRLQRKRPVIIYKMV